MNCYLRKNFPIMICAVFFAAFSASASEDKKITQLQGSTWEWVRLIDPVKKTEIARPEEYTITFSADGKASIHADCNQAQASYEAGADGSITITIGPMTMAACPPESKSDEFVKKLGYVSHYFLKDEHLHMDMMADGGTFEFRPQQTKMHQPSGGPRTERLQFEKGKSELSVGGKIRGYESVEYLVGAGAGQTLEVNLETRHGATYFNVFAPGAQPGRDAALFGGESGSNRFQGKLTVPGDYRIQVYMMRSAARRNETSVYTLKIKIEGSPDPTAKSPEPGPWPMDIDASGDLPCSKGAETLDLQCAFKVKRNTYGATIWTVMPGESRDPKQMRVEDLRVLYFESFDNNPKWSTNDSSRVIWNRVEDNWVVTVGAEERYRIPDAAIYGG